MVVAVGVDKFRFQIDRAVHLLDFSGPTWRVTDPEVRKKGKDKF